MQGIATGIRGLHCLFQALEAIRSSVWESVDYRCAARGFFKRRPLKP